MITYRNTKKYLIKFKIQNTINGQKELANMESG